MDSVVIRAMSIPLICTSFLSASASAHFSLRMVAATAMVKPVIPWLENDSLLLVLTSFVFCCVSLWCPCGCLCCWVLLPLVWWVLFRTWCALLTCLSCLWSSILMISWNFGQDLSEEACGPKQFAHFGTLAVQSRFWWVSPPHLPHFWCLFLLSKAMWPKRWPL